ncbi:hypothetical protein DFH05DRAFT_726373 [Lentinula detonsa]|uniref:Uncharacterized protein n=1 Tax=Lentinula detonsa TaxID=2804962 RepID=A0A9W8TSY0_9AGAR|nr:hypothetical protein DFH05DRAFT_726373 [Lentinula detonsa]
MKSLRAQRVIRPRSVNLCRWWISYRIYSPNVMRKRYWTVLCPKQRRSGPDQVQRRNFESAFYFAQGGGPTVMATYAALLAYVRCLAFIGWRSRKKIIVPFLIDSEKKIEESNIDALFWKIRLRERVTRNYFDPSKFAFFPQESVDLRPSASFVLYLGVSNLPHVPRVGDLTKTNAKPKAETTTLAQSSTDSHQRHS